MLKFENLKNKNGIEYLVAFNYDCNNSKSKILAFAKMVHLSERGKQIVKKLLTIQKIAINNDYNKLLRKVNEKLFDINEIYRKNVINLAKKINVSYDGAKTFNFITCYNQIEW
jgi:hypothetical protein